ncbi:MAG: IS701 family transposase [Coleofasciculus sp. B1-GNL1-01]|uniref:IS701 family transposase n=1 Tax=Coleofasciculus sp. B1-GNL1-01 TaxID=3068484 RepID=UPI0033046B36
MTQARVSRSTVRFIDECCNGYKSIFPEVRSFEAFKQLHLGMLSDIKRKSLPEIAAAVGLKNHQSLHHFISQSPWELKELREKRIEVILRALKGQEIIVIIDETGDRKKGKKTDYVSRQYIGNLGKVESGIVAVTAYGIVEGMTIVLSFQVYKPKNRLKEGEPYLSKPQIAAHIIRDLKKQGFNFSLVLADSLYGESESNFLATLEELNLNYVVAIRSNHAVWMPRGQRVMCNNWREFDRIFSDGKKQVRYIREVIYGKKRRQRYWEITTNTETLPKNETWNVMTKVPNIKYYEVGNLYGLRNWIEYGLKQKKNELGWADFRLTSYSDIEKWWEIVCSAYLLVSLHSQKLATQKSPLNPSCISQTGLGFLLSEHPRWDAKEGWKNLLNNLRLILQPLLAYNDLRFWLNIFPIPYLDVGLNRLITWMNRFPGAVPEANASIDFHFSSA